MPLSAKSRASTRQSRPDSCVFRITKSSKVNAQPVISKQKLNAITEHVHQKSQSQLQQSTHESSNKKRRRDALDSDIENEEVATRPQKSIRKARPSVAIPTPPASSPEPEQLSETLEELRSLHKSFVQALAVYYVHNGTTNAVALSALMPAMTRLWKRRTVSTLDIQRMLAVWESLGDVGHKPEHKTGPFKLISVGIGSNQHVKLEYALGNISGAYIEKELHQKYEAAIEKLFRSARRDSEAYSFVFEPIICFPTLKCQLGIQTQARQEKITSIRDTILSKTPKQLSTVRSTTTAQTEPDFSTLTISDSSDSKQSIPTTREERLKSRTLSLFDRLRAKQLANSSSTPATSASLLRRRALHRIPELIDVLRLKQSQKLNALFRSDLHGIQTGPGTRMAKVSFGLEQLVQEIRDSGRVTVAEAEVKEALMVLGREIPDTWCSVYMGEGNAVKCVTLQGDGWRKEEVRSWCLREIANMDGK